MPSAQTIILEHVCPALGVVTGNVMFFSPARDVQRAVRKGSLGDLNPTPWAFMTGNCLGWVTYAFLIDNIYVYLANAPGFLLSIWLNLSAAKLQYQSHHSKEMRQSFVQFLLENETNSQLHLTQQDQSGHNDTPTTQDVEQPSGRVARNVGKLASQITSLHSITPAPAQHERFVLIIVIVWTIVISIISFGDELSSTAREYIVGFVVNFNLLFFYGAPLSTIWTVIRTNNSASIHIPTMVTNTANATFWTAYAIAVLDPFIYIPNGIGVILGLAQFVLYLTYPRLPHDNENDQADNSNQDIENDNSLLPDRGEDYNDDTTEKDPGTSEKELE